MSVYITNCTVDNIHWSHIFGFWLVVFTDKQSYRWEISLFNLMVIFFVSYETFWSDSAWQLYTYTVLTFTCTENRDGYLLQWSQSMRADSGCFSHSSLTSIFEKPVSEFHAWNVQLVQKKTGDLTGYWAAHAAKLCFYLITQNNTAFL